MNATCVSGYINVGRNEKADELLPQASCRFGQSHTFKCLQMLSKAVKPREACKVLMYFHHGAYHWGSVGQCGWWVNQTFTSNKLKELSILKDVFIGIYRWGIIIKNYTHIEHAQNRFSRLKPHIFPAPLSSSLIMKRIGWKTLRQFIKSQELFVNAKLGYIGEYNELNQWHKVHCLSGTY